MSKSPLPRGVTFTVPERGKHKYTAHIPIFSGKVKKVSFGHRDYKHYKDSVPISKGGGKWTHSDHLDKKRRDNYRKRHGGLVCKNGERCIDIKYSPAWFSYYYLW
jgi:hypothetical protein